MPKRSKKDVKPSEIFIVLPGDTITSYITPTHHTPEHSLSAVTTSTAIPSCSAVSKLGTGLRYDSIKKQVYATCAGRLITKRTKDDMGNTISIYYVEPCRSTIRRYQPNVDDRIIGIVVDRSGTDDNGGDLYRIDINASHYGILSNLQFSGATKRNKPILLPGQIIYSRILTIANQNHLFDPILSCINGPYDTGIPSKDWTTKEGCYGELRGGTLCRISMNLARNILDPTSQHNIILNELAKNKNLTFEVSIGLNGYLWINSTISEYIILIQNAIQNSNVLTAEQNRAMVKNLIYIVDKQLQQRNDSS
jgi:exosome complex component RRP40